MSARSVAPLTVNGALDDDGGCCCCCCWVDDCRRPSGTQGHHPETITPIGPVAGPIRPTRRFESFFASSFRRRSLRPAEDKPLHCSLLSPTFCFLAKSICTLFPMSKSSYDGALIRNLIISNRRKYASCGFVNAC